MFKHKNILAISVICMQTVFLILLICFISTRHINIYIYYIYASSIIEFLHQTFVYPFILYYLFLLFIFVNFYLYYLQEQSILFI